MKYETEVVMSSRAVVTVIFLLIGILSISAVYSQDYHQLSFLRADLKNETNLLNLQEGPDNDSLFKRETVFENNFSLAIESPAHFKNALNSFFLNQQRERSFLDYSVQDNSLQGRLQISFIAGSDYHTDFEEQYLHLYRGVQIRTNVNDRLLMWGEWWAGRFQGDLDFAEETSPLIKGFFKPHGENQTYTNLNRIWGQVSYLLPFGNLSLGRGNHLVGSNIGGSIILSDAVNDYGFFSGELNFGKLKLSFMHANLIPDDLSIYQENDSQDRYLVMHQIDFNPRKNLNFFFGENIIYAQRSVDFSYLLPHTFLRITEHNLQDRDNVHIYSGMNWYPKNGLLLYGQLMLGELRKSEIFGDWWGNKYALQGGVSYSYGEDLFAQNTGKLRTTLEATAVRPWLYTHKFSATPYSNDGMGLGFPGGSNLIQGAVEQIVPILPNLTYSHYASFTRQGDLGNSFSINYNDRPSETAKWLEGETTDFLLSRSVLTFALSAHQQFKLGIDWRKENNQDWKKELVFGYRAIY